MKKGVIIAILLGILILLPLISAQTESNFNRFADNIKLFFYSGESKVNLALEIREKEINHALENFENNEEITKNIERARKKLLIVQERVSVDSANEVKTSTNNLMNKVENYKNISEEFENYILEEGKEEQTLTREIIKDNRTGKKYCKNYCRMGIMVNKK